MTPEQQDEFLRELARGFIEEPPLEYPTYEPIIELFDEVDLASELKRQ